MFCPQCFAEYREGFTTCSTCDLGLVESLPEETLEKLAERRRGRLGPVLAGLWRRVKDLSVGARAVGVFLLITGLHSGIFLVEEMVSLAGDGEVSWDLVLLASVVIRAGLSPGLPLLAAVGVLLKKTWARPLCLIVFAIGAMQGIAGVAMLWASSTRRYLDVGEQALSPETLHAWLGWWVSTTVIDLTALWAVSRWGLGKEPPSRISEIFD
jgi:hypothetical protein